MKKMLAVALVFSLAATQILAGSSASLAAKVKVKKVKVSAPYSKVVYVAKGKSIKLFPKVTVTPNKSKYKKVKFISKNKKIATVTSKGVVKGKKVGKTKIQVISKTNKKKKATITLRVKKYAVKKVTLNQKSASLNVGDSLFLKAKVTAKKGASKKVYWKSSDIKVATVSQKGTVKTVGAGTATITVMAIDGSKKKATCKIAVANATPGDTTLGDTNGGDATVVTPTPGATDAPTATAEPGATNAPTATEEPEATNTPGTTAEPGATNTPAPTEEPGVTVTPTPTLVVTPTLTPVVTPTPTPVTTTLKIESVDVLDNSRIAVVFNEVRDFASSNFTVKIKSGEADEYTKTATIRKVSASTDASKYQIYLAESTGNYIPNNGYIQLTVSDTNGAQLVKEAYYNHDCEVHEREVVYRMTLGSSYSFTMGANSVGKITFAESDTLPTGFSYTTLLGETRLTGTATKVGTTKSTVTGTDEVGNTYHYTYYFITGDSSNLSAVAKPGYGLPGKSASTSIYAIGGSGSYTYTAVEGDYDFSVNSSGTVSATFAQAGKYQVQVDVSDGTLTTRVTVEFTVEATYLLDGVLKDLGGTGIEYLGGMTAVYFAPHDPDVKERYNYFNDFSASTGGGGYFYKYVPAGTYDILIKDPSGYLIHAVYDVVVEDKNVDVGDIVLPKCQVTLTAPNSVNLYLTYWYDENDICVGRNASFLVNPGTYTLHSNPDVSPVSAHLYDFTVTFTATDKTVEKVVTANQRVGGVPELTLGKSHDVELVDSQRQYFQFTPTETGTYKLYTTGLSESLYLNVYTDNDLSCKTSWRSASGSATNEAMLSSLPLTAGNTYYIYPRLVWGGEDNFSITIEKVES